MKLTSRLARDAETGKNYKVRGDMTYNEWYEGLPQEKKTAIKAYKNRHTDEVQYTKYVKRLGGENMPKTLELFQRMKYNDSEWWGKLKQEYRDNRYFLQGQLQYILPNGKNEFIPSNALIKSVRTIAGKGSDVPIRVEPELIDSYGGKAGEWRKNVGKIESGKYIFDVHWYEFEGRQYGTKLKFRKDK